MRPSLPSCPKHAMLPGMNPTPPESSPRPAGTWGLRMLIRLGAFALGVLVYWLLGFLVQDIRSVPGPEYDLFAKRHVPEALTQRRETLQASIETLRREESARQETQRITADASHNLQRTMQQLIELQKLSTERQVALTDGDRANLATNLQQFLKFQTEYQALSAELAKLGEQRRQVEAESREVDKQIETLSQAARKDQAKAWAAHRLKLAAGQLALLLPLLAGAGWLLARRKESPYLVAHLAVGVAILLKVVGVVHEYFPKRVFNYLLISALIVVVFRLLAHWIRSAAQPKPAAVLKQRREAYERFLCPTCEHPIRTGPRRFLYWTRRTVHKVLPPPGPDLKPEPYSCPACGTGLFSPCAACGGIRHDLLPHCEHCGTGK